MALKNKNENYSLQTVQYGIPVSRHCPFQPFQVKQQFKNSTLVLLKRSTELGRIKSRGLKRNSYTDKQILERIPTKTPQPQLIQEVQKYFINNYCNNNNDFCSLKINKYESIKIFYKLRYETRKVLESCFKIKRKIGSEINDQSKSVQSEKYELYAVTRKQLLQDIQENIREECWGQSTYQFLKYLLTISEVQQKIICTEQRSKEQPKWRRSRLIINMFFFF